jgi:preprotein translocase subunit Sec63
MQKIVQSPYEILGLPIDAKPDLVKKQYKLLIRKFPPEQKPVEFNEIRTAYDRITTELFSENPKTVFPLYQHVLKAQNEQAISSDVRAIAASQDLLKGFETPFNTHFELEKILDTITL